MSSRILPKKITELGRIRIGDREATGNGKTRPHKLQNFRFTSANKPLLQFAANLYGGEVHPWEGEGAQAGQYELYSTVNAIDVLVPTMSAISITYEQWRAGGCTLRCTGETISHSPLKESLIGAPCTCPEDDHERDAQAKRGAACARILRLNVLLPDLPGMGVWRLETKGYYATAELLGSLEMLQMGQHEIIEAALRLEWRTVKRYQDGKSTSFQFAVPVLWPKYTPRQMLAAANRDVLLMEPPAQKALPPGERFQATVADLYGGERTAEQYVPNFAREGTKFQQSTTNPSQDTSYEKKPKFDGNTAENSQTDMHGVYDDAVLEQKRGGESIRQQIDLAWQTFGLTPEQIANFWQKQCARFGVDDSEQLTVAHLTTARKDTDAWIQREMAKRAQQEEALARPEPDDTPEAPDWRPALTALLNVVKEQELLARMFEAADDADTPDDIGRSILAEAQSWVEAQTMVEA